MPFDPGKEKRSQPTIKQGYRLNNFKSKYGPWGLVAGGSQGIGGAWSDALAQRGLNVVVVSHDEAANHAKVQELQDRYQVEARPLTLDLSTDDMLESITQATNDLEIGFLVYNAGHADLGTFTKQPLDHEIFRLNLNVRGPMLLSHHFGKKMEKRKRGGIALMSSLGGLNGNPYNAGYSASKAYDLVLAEGLWYEMAKNNVDVIGVLAGLTSSSTVVVDDEFTAKHGKPMEAVDVVEQAFAKLGKVPSFAPGKNRWLAILLTRILPRKKAIATMGKNYEKMWPELIGGD
jgi:hypothetical protein